MLRKKNSYRMWNKPRRKIFELYSKILVQRSKFFGWNNTMGSSFSNFFRQAFIILEVRNASLFVKETNVIFSKKWSHVNHVRFMHRIWASWWHKDILKRNKSIIPMSIMHHDKTITERKKKPKMIQFYIEYLCRSLAIFWQNLRYF